MVLEVIRTDEHDVTTPPTSPPTTPGRAPDRPRHVGPGARPIDAAREALCDGLGPAQFGRYFGSDGGRLRIADDSLDVRVPDRFTAGLIERRFGDALTEAARVATRSDSGSFRCVVEDEPDLPSIAQSTCETAEAAATPSGIGRRRARQAETTGQVRTLENFLVGQSNALAHAACTRLASGSRELPVLFLHGGCGLGKTHLLLGIVRAVRERAPSIKARYLTSERFLNSYVACVRDGKASSFVPGFHGLDLLCLDDIQTLAGKTKTQHQLLQVIEAVLMGGGRVAMSSDSHPKALRSMSRALASRFVAGPVIGIGSPGIDLSARLIERMAAARGVPLEPGTAQHIAARALSESQARGESPSGRDFEGIVSQLDAVWRVLGHGSGTDAAGWVGPALASRAMDLRGSSGGGAGNGGDGVAGIGGFGKAGGAGRPVPLERVMHEVGQTLGVTLEEMVGTGRARRTVLARGLYAYLARELTSHSYPEIARGMARKNHSTVITADQRIRGQIRARELVGVGCLADGMELGALCARVSSAIRDAAG